MPFASLVLLLGACNTFTRSDSELSTAAVCGTANLALNQPALASSTEAGFLDAGQAFDGDATTCWASERSDRRRLQVDLGSVQPFNHIQFTWETAYGKAYKIRVSDDGNSWRTVYETTTGDGTTDDFDVNASGRYVRLEGTERGSPYGYALYEFGVYRH